MTTALVGQKILVKLETEPNSGVFTHPCLINLTRSFTLEAELQDDQVEDCENPDAPATVYRFKKSKSFTVEGEGKLDTASLEYWLDFAEGAEPKNAQIIFNATGANGGLTITCQLHCGRVAVTGTPKENATASVSLSSHGAWTRAANA